MKRKALFIGGTGTISTAITARIAAEGEWELTLLNRGSRSDAVPPGVRVIQADISDEADVARKLAGLQWDCVCDFIGFVPAQVERDWRLFRSCTRQYMYISSASAYQKPAVNPYITESTPLSNPHWQYSRDKIACEAFLMEKFREEGFPVTIARATPMTTAASPWPSTAPRAPGRSSGECSTASRSSSRATVRPSGRSRTTRTSPRASAA